MIPKKMDAASYSIAKRTAECDGGGPYAELFAHSLALEAELKEWQDRMKALTGSDTPDMAGNAIIRLRRGLKEAAGIIENLQAVQNGCPLPKYETKYNEANAAAIAWLERNPL